MQLEDAQSAPDSKWKKNVIAKSQVSTQNIYSREKCKRKALDQDRGIQNKNTSGQMQTCCLQTNG